MRLEYLEAHVESTKEVLSVYREQLTLGKRTLLDLLDIQNELLRSQIVLVSGQYAEAFARYRVLASTATCWQVWVSRQRISLTNNGNHL